MGIFDKLKQGINPENDPGYDEQEEYTDQIQNGFGDTYQQAPANQQYTQGDQYAAQEQYQQTSGNIGMDGVQVSGASLQLKVVKPDRFEDVAQIANHLLSRRTVVLNLEETNKETARRLLDFLSGVAYSINGDLKRVANNTYVITPCNVEVTGDQLRRQRKQQMDDATNELYNNEI